MTKAKISASHKGKTKSEAKKMSLAQNGKKHAPETIAKRAEKMRGRTVSEETRQKISSALKGRGVPEERKCRIRETTMKDAKKVLCVDTGEVFDSMTEAAKSRSKTRQSLAYHIKGESNTFDGHHWVLL